MNMHPRSSSNGYGRRKFERDNATRFDNKFQTGKTIPNRTTSGKGVGLESSSRDRFIYLTTCLIGHQVEVQVLDGSVFSGIFHATNADDFGVVLKMARSIKDGSDTQGQKSISNFPSKPPARTMIIPAKDLVQLIAKGVPLTRDGLTDELQHEKQLELMTDSCISQYRHVDAGRELERWVPDENDPGCPELDNIFDGHWNREWDQFEANATLFGVKSTFDEELYTTKLERGPRTRELEREALRIAREIEGETTVDLHLAEERGIQLVGNLELDEETRFSSVFRGVDDSGYGDVEDMLSDSRNDETFGDVSSSIVGKPLMGMSTEKTSDGTRVSSKSPSMGEIQSSLTATSRDVHHSGSEDHGRQLLTELLSKQSSMFDPSRVHDNQSSGHAECSSLEGDTNNQVVLDQNRASKTEDPEPLQRLKKESSDKIALSPNATTFDPSNASKNQEMVSSFSEISEGAMPPKSQGTSSSLVRPSSSASSTSECGGAASTSAGRGLSTSSSVTSLSSEKSSLNPNAKEFKLNPNAKSFVPSQASLRPSSPVAGGGPFYHPANVASLSQMHGMPLSMGIGPSFAVQQPVMFNPQAAPMPQPYYHPNGPQYGQQMMIGQARPFMYMPTYPTEMPYNGREF